MSNLAKTTERKAILQLAKCLKHFERLCSLNMSATDAHDARTAENLIKVIIQSNGYETIERQGKGTGIAKQKILTN